MANDKVLAWRRLTAITGRGQANTGLNFRNATEFDILRRLAVVQRERNIVAPVQAPGQAAVPVIRQPNDKVLAWRRLVAITGRGRANTGLNFRNATEAQILRKLAQVQQPIVAAPAIQQAVAVPVVAQLTAEEIAIRDAERLERQRNLERIREEQRVERFERSRAAFDVRAEERAQQLLEEAADVEINEATQEFLQEEITQLQAELVDDRTNITELATNIGNLSTRLEELRARTVLSVDDEQRVARNVFNATNQQLTDARNQINVLQTAMDDAQRRLREIVPLEQRLRESEEEALNAAAERFQRQLDELETQIEIQHQEFNRVNQFREFRVNSNADNVRGLYIAIDKFIEEVGDIPFVVLFLIDKLTGRPRRITINTQFLDTFEEFNDRLAQISFGNVIGSAPISDDQFDLMVDRFDAIFINPLEAACGTFDKLLCDVVVLKPSGKNTCIKDTMKHFGYEIDKKVKTIDKLLAYIVEQKLPVEIIMNKIALTPSKKITQIYNRKQSKLYKMMRAKKQVVVKLCKLKPEDYFMYYDQLVEHNEEGFKMELNKETGEMDKRVIFKSSEVKRALYSRNEKHIAPVKSDDDNNIIKRSDLYISGRKEIYEIIDGNARLVLETKQINQYMKKGTCSKPPIRKSNCRHRYLFIDYETVINWKIKAVMIPISLSIIDLNQTDLDMLVELEKQHKGFIKANLIDKKDDMTDVLMIGDDGENFECTGSDLVKFKIKCKKMRMNAVTYIGYDCTMKMMDYIDSQFKKNPQYTIVTFNGSYFDNLILLSDLLDSPDHTDKVSDIFYTHNMLRNFKIYGRHELLDLARHTAGSLKYNCSEKGFKINVFPKKAIDFKVIQAKYESGELDIMMDNYNGKNKDLNYVKTSCEFIDQLINYNDYDVLSLATLYRLYENAMDEIIEKAIYTKKDAPENKDGILLKDMKVGDMDDKRMQLRNFKTIGSLAYNMLGKYWREKLDLDIPTFVFKKEFIPKDASDVRKKAINKRNWEIHEKNERFYKYYKDMHKFKTAGRVELFNGIKKYLGRARSLDITSSYPYSMAVKPVYYPTGEMIEVKYFEDMPKDKLGWFYCDIDQKSLRLRGLPNIVAEKTKIENIWQTKKVLHDYFVSSVKIEQMIKYGMKVAKSNGSRKAEYTEEAKWWYSNISYWKKHKALKQRNGNECWIDGFDTPEKIRAESKKYYDLAKKEPEPAKADLVIYHGIYFTDRIRGCDLFEPLLSAMMTKVLQDQLKQDGKEDYNAAIRQTVKLFLNCISGKIIEQIHINKIMEIKNAFHFHQMNESKRVSKLNTITILGDRIFCSYTKREQDMLNTHRPIYWGILVYDYSQNNLYDNTLAAGWNSAIEEGLSEELAAKRQIAYRKEIFLCDTDACKMSSKAADLCLARMSRLEVPHWDKVETYDKRYKNHKMYDPNSKVFGGYEDEFECYNNINYFLAKKHYAGFFDPKQAHDKPTENILDGKITNQGEIDDYNELVEKNELATLDFHFKGVNEKSLVINTRPYKPDPLIFKKITKKVKGVEKINYSVIEQKKAYTYYESQLIRDNTKISGKRCCEYFDILSQGKVLHILCASFRKQMSNLKRNTGIDDKNRFNQNFNRISMCYTVKAIKCIEKHKDQVEERLIYGKDYDIINCDGESVDKRGDLMDAKKWHEKNDIQDDFDPTDIIDDCDYDYDPNNEPLDEEEYWMHDEYDPCMDILDYD